MTQTEWPPFLYFFERCWKVIFVLTTIVAFLLLSKLYQFQTDEHFTAIRKGSVVELLLAGIPIAFVYYWTDLLFHRAIDQYIISSFLNISKYPTRELQVVRGYTIVKWIWSTIYYSVSASTAYLILQPSSFMPTWMGGNGTCLNLFQYIHSFNEASTAMRVYYLVQFGKHLSRFFTHALIRSEGNFYEFVLHHALSTILIVFSYLSNMWIIGIFILGLHDASDCTLILARIYREYRAGNTVVMYFLYVLAIVNWISCRHGLFTYCCVYSAMKSLKDYFMGQILFQKEFKDVLLIPYIFMAFMLLALQVMHAFWTYHIIMSFLFVAKVRAKKSYD